MSDLLEKSIVLDFAGGDLPLEHLYKMVDAHHLKPEHFKNAEMRTAIETILENRGDDRVKIVSELQKKIQLKELFTQNGSALSETVIAADAHIHEVAEEGRISEMKNLLDSALEENRGKASAQYIADDLSRKFNAFAQQIGAKPTAKGISISDIVDPGPDEENPDALLREGYLRRGQILLLASVTGSGKSVISVQMAYAFAAGEPFMGIRPIRPLKIGIFETEDDNTELVDFRESMRRGYREVYGWTDLKIAAAEQNINFLPTEYKMGKEFIDHICAVQRENHYDFIIVNPLQDICGFDLSNNNEMRNYFAKLLRPAINQADTKCGLLLIHHTNKPSMSNGRSGFGGDEYAEYLGAGAAAIPGNCRAILVVMPEKKRGHYRLIAAKRGEHLDWPEPTDDKASKPVKYIRHSTRAENMRFWREDEGHGEPSTMVSAADGTPTVRQDAEQLAENLRKMARTQTDARDFSKASFGSKRGQLAYDEVNRKPEEFGLIIRATGLSARQKVIGSEEGVEKAISVLLEKFSQEQSAKIAKNQRKS